VLTERLRTLENAGFLHRHYEQTIPPCLTYGITHERSRKVVAQLEGLARKRQRKEVAVEPSAWRAMGRG
jgi:DNA-binding HxlR family transcriptional regulator